MKNSLPLGDNMSVVSENEECFVYGSSIYAYIRNYRINKVAILLKERKYSIAFIAGDVGYESPSKFSVAFKKTPLDYRKTFA